MKVPRVAVALVVLAQLVPSLALANDGRDPGAGKGEQRVVGGQGGAGGSQGGPSGAQPSTQPPSSRPPGSGARHHGNHGSRHSSRGGWYVRPGWGGYGGWGGWGGWWGWDPYWYGGWGYGYGPRWGYTVVYPDPAMRHGALDLDVSPERAEIWVDGEPIGVADDFDGFPNYLWLPQGTYDVAIYLPGFTTIARQYSIYSGLVIDVEDRLARGESVHPTDLDSKSSVNRDERLRRDREAAEEARRAGEESEAWTPRPGRDESLDARGEPARLRLDILPEDASVYLDGRFLGTGRDLSRLRAGLLVDPGTHTLEVVRPGYAPAQRTIEVEAGTEQEVKVALEEGG